MIKAGVKVIILLLAIYAALFYMSLFIKNDKVALRHASSDVTSGEQVGVPIPTPTESGRVGAENVGKENKFSMVSVADLELSAEIVDSPEKQALGLSGRESLGENEGMLFVFEVADNRYFWMKDMNFSIDIVWIGENKEVVDIIKNVTPESYPEKFSPKTPAKYVLEVNAGFSDEYKIKIGDLVEF